MNEATTYQAVRIGDIADWRLICTISTSGMNAYLKHVNPTEEIVTLFEEKWPDTADGLLERIENAVYDHPQVLDDFSSDIILMASRSIWVPTAMVADDEDEAARLYNQVYSSPEEDILAEEVGEATCLYSLVPGLHSFLRRTFPGARVHSHLAVMARRFRERSADMPRIYADIRQGMVDFVAFDRKNILMAACHQWNVPEDIQYHIFNIMNVYGLKPNDVQVSLSGPREIKTNLMRDLRAHLDYVMLTMMPGIGAKAGMPLPAALMVRN